MNVKKSLFFLLLGILIPMMTANCTEKKGVEEKAAEKTENLIGVDIQIFEKFVQVTADNVKLHKTADANSPTLEEWVLEGEYEEGEGNRYCQWSDMPGKAGYAKDDLPLHAYNGRIYIVLGEEGDFYKVDTNEAGSQTESAYIQKSSVKEVKNTPLTAEMIEKPDFSGRGSKYSIVKDGKYKNLVMYLMGGERTLTGYELHVGMLTDGIIVSPENYYIDCRWQEDQKEDIVFKEEDGHTFLDYNPSMAEDYSLNTKKLSTDQIAKILEMVKRQKPDLVEYSYSFPSGALSEITFFQLKAK